MSLPTPEYAVLQLAAATSWDEESARALAERVHRGLDWELLFHDATRHGLRPRLYARLMQGGPDASPAEGYARLLRSLQHVISPYTALSLFLTAEMRAIAEVFETAGLPYLVLKGPTLAEAYGGIGYRPFVDNDLLIRRSDFERVDEVLGHAGFGRRPRDGMRLRGYLYIHGELTYSRRVTGQVSTLDVHTALVPPGLAYRETFDDLVARARGVTVAGAPVLALSWEDALLAQVVNGLKDQWGRLRLVSDVAAVASMVRDWDAVFTRAQLAGGVRGLHVALLLAANEALSPPPPEILARAEADTRAQRLAAWIAQRLRRPYSDVPNQWHHRAHLNLAAQDDWSGGVRYTAFVTLRRLTERYVDPH